MDRCLRIILLSATLAASLPVHAQSRIDCNALNSRILKHEVHYCVYLPAGYDAGATKRPPQNFPVLFFLQEFVPLIETKYRVSKGRSNRAISGISMGGYGALRFAFAHPEMFSAVSAQSAALITETPQELDTAAKSGAPMGKLLATVYGSPIEVAHWKENSPFVLANRNQAALRRTAIYFNCGQDDNYGFEKGATGLHEQLQKEKVEHEYHPYPGDHSLGYFLAHFTEVMEFHSRAFGLR